MGAVSDLKVTLKYKEGDGHRHHYILKGSITKIQWDPIIFLDH